MRAVDAQAPPGVGAAVCAGAAWRLAGGGHRLRGRRLAGGGHLVPSVWVVVWEPSFEGGPQKVLHQGWKEDKG